METRMSACTKGIRRPGRPVQLDPEAREKLILDAAERVMASRGMARSSMSAIAREAGMSKRTIYDIFGSKEELVTACVRRIRLTFAQPLSEQQKQLPFVERLRLMLSPASTYLSGEMPNELLRVIIFEALRQPQLAKAFLEEGPKALLATIQVEIDRAVDKGEIGPCDSRAVAALLRDMVYESVIERLLDPNGFVPNDAYVTARFELALQVFLKGIAN